MATDTLETPAPKSRTRAAKGPRPDPARARADVALLLKQASDPTRVHVLLLLLDGERHVGDLCAMLAQSQPAVSHHLALLRHGRMVEPRRVGKHNYYSLTAAGRRLALTAHAMMEGS